MDKDKEGGTIPLINDLEIVGIFKDKVKKEKVSVINLIN